MTALLAVPIAWQHTAAGGIATYFIVGSVFLGAVNLVPFSTGARTSDGKKLWKLLFDIASREAIFFALTYLARVKEIQALYASGQIIEACDRADEVISESKRLMSQSVDSEFRVNLDAFEKLFGRIRVAINAYEDHRTADSLLE